MSNLIDSFKKRTYPTIELYHNSFQIKGRDNLSFRSFDFDEVEKIKYFDPNNNWWSKIILAFNKFSIPYWRNDKYRYLKIYKTNGGTWNYPMPYRIESELVEILKLIEKTADRDFLEISY